MLSYEDGVAALVWLAEVFGFQEITRMVDDDGRLAHGEMQAGRSRIMLACPTPAYENPLHHRQHCAAAKRWSETPWAIDGLLVYVDDVSAHFERVRKAGARILSQPEGGPPGKRYRVEDLEGHRWMFMQR